MKLSIGRSCTHVTLDASAKIIPPLAIDFADMLCFRGVLLLVAKAQKVFYIVSNLLSGTINEDD